MCFYPFTIWVLVLAADMAADMDRQAIRPGRFRRKDRRWSRYRARDPSRRLLIRRTRRLNPRRYRFQNRQNPPRSRCPCRCLRRRRRPYGKRTPSPRKAKARPTLSKIVFGSFAALSLFVMPNRISFVFIINRPLPNRATFDAPYNISIVCVPVLQIFFG